MKWLCTMYVFGFEWFRRLCLCFLFFIFYFFYQKHMNIAASGSCVLCMGPTPLSMSTHCLVMALLVGPVYCSRDPQISLFSNFFIKNESHDTIHTFKNYFVTVFSVFSFSINKFNPNGPYISHSCLVFFFVLEELIKTVNYI